MAIKFTHKLVILAAHRLCSADGWSLEFPRPFSGLTHQLDPPPTTGIIGEHVTDGGRLSKRCY